MREMKIALASAAAALAACSGESSQPDNLAKEQAELAPGLYEASWTVSALESTDRSTPATKLKVGERGSVKGCVTQGPAIDPALFAEGSDKCTAAQSYTRGGRISIQMRCERPGEAGPVMLTVAGTSTADSFEGEISTSTYLTGYGDYAMTRKITGRRLGDCTASEAASG